MKRQLWYFCVVGAIAGVFALSTLAQQKKQPADLIIAGGTVVTMDADRRILEDGAIAAKGDVILEVGTRAQIESKYSARTHIGANDRLILPGFINDHTHAPITLLRALKADVTLPLSLQNYIFPTDSKH